MNGYGSGIVGACSSVVRAIAAYVDWRVWRARTGLRKLRTTVYAYVDQGPEETTRYKSRRNEPPHLWRCDFTEAGHILWHRPRTGDEDREEEIADACTAAGRRYPFSP